MNKTIVCNNSLKFSRFKHNLQTLTYESEKNAIKQRKNAIEKPLQA